MSLGFSLAVRNARAQAVVDQLDKAALPGSLALFATPQPPTGDPPGGGWLVNIPLQRPCGTVANGVITFAVTQPTNLTSLAVAVDHVLGGGGLPVHSLPPEELPDPPGSPAPRPAQSVRQPAGNRAPAAPPSGAP